MAEEQGSELERLRAENAALKAEAERLKGVRDDLWSHEIYLSARKKMLAGLAALIAVLAAIGGITLHDINSDLRAYVSTEARKGIDATIKEEVARSREQVEEEIGQASEQLSREVGRQANEFLQAELRQVRTQIAEVTQQETQQFLEKLEQDRSEAIRETRISVAQVAGAQRAAQSAMSPPNRRVDPPATAAPPATSAPADTPKFWVIAGSSPVRADLVNELKRVQKASERSARPPLRDAFPSVRIGRVVEGDPNYALIVGTTETLPAASRMKDQALAYGFRPDTYIWGGY